ncbi:rbcL, partial [Symbiodinium microadriaticum]
MCDGEVDDESLRTTQANVGIHAATCRDLREAGRQTRSTILPTTVVPVKDSRVARRALDQSSRYADLSLDEATLI